MTEHGVKMFQSVFENSPVGLVLVNKDTTLRAANRYMFKTFNLTNEKVDGCRFGNLFKCASVKHPDIECGMTELCENCGLRSGIMAVLNDDAIIPDTVMDHSFFIDDTEQKKWFIISASRITTEDDIFAVISFSDITIQKEYEALLNNQLTLDMATGITNKYTLLKALKTLSVGKESLAIAMIDFDDFKLINDTYGHIVGDKVLKIFCSCATAYTRKQDILGRFGGEEFMLIFPGSSAGLMIHALQRIAGMVREKCEYELGFKPTFSVGVAEYTSDALNNMDVSVMVAEIDAELYQAKKRGKNMIVIGGLSVPFVCSHDQQIKDLRKGGV